MKHFKVISCLKVSSLYDKKLISLVFSELKEDIKVIL